ncbi:MAG: hypothetical protein WC455_14550 [Dehalococcoidia bacterium]|jgi:hypothetical protein
MATIGKLSYILGLDTVNFKAQLTASERSMMKWRKAAEKDLNHITSVARKTALGMIALGASAAYIASKFINAADKAQQYRIRLEMLLGSQAASNELFKQMEIYASGVTHTYEDVMEAGSAFAGVMKGGNEEIMKWIQLAGDITAVTPLTFKEVIGQIIRMYAAGANSADLFRERGTTALLEFVQNVKYTAEETRKQVIEQWLKADSKFKEGAKRLAVTWSGMMSMMQDAWFIFRKDVMEGGVFELFKDELQGMLNKIKQMKADGSYKEFVQNIVFWSGTAFATIKQLGISALATIEIFYRGSMIILRQAQGINYGIRAIFEQNGNMAKNTSASIGRGWNWLMDKNKSGENYKFDEKQLGYKNKNKSYETFLAVTRDEDEQFRKLIDAFSHGRDATQVAFGEYEIWLEKTLNIVKPGEKLKELAQQIAEGKKTLFEAFGSETTKSIPGVPYAKESAGISQMIDMVLRARKEIEKAKQEAPAGPGGGGPGGLLAEGYKRALEYAKEYQAWFDSKGKILFASQYMSGKMTESLLDIRKRYKELKSEIPQIMEVPDMEEPTKQLRNWRDAWDEAMVVVRAEFFGPDSLYKDFVDMGMNIQDSWSRTIEGLITGTSKFGDFFKRMILDVASSFARLASQSIARKLFESTLGNLSGSFLGGLFSGGTALSAAGGGGVNIGTLNIQGQDARALTAIIDRNAKRRA